MRLLAILTCIALVFGCTTRQGTKIAMGVGVGVAATGGVFIATKDDDMDGLGAGLFGTTLVVTGGLIALCSLLIYVADVTNDPKPAP